MWSEKTCSLSNVTYRPFDKSNNKSTCIDKESKHPLSILRQIPSSIEFRISKYLKNLHKFIKKF